MASALRISVLWMLLSEAMIRAEIIVETQKLFFLTNEEVAMPVSYSGATIAYRVKNYSGDVVMEGQQGDAHLELGLFGPGYYTLELSSGSDALTTNFAVMTPIVANTAWPFGAHTHFAQSHDPALLPAFKAAGIAHIRDEQYWSWLEQQQGIFEFPEHYVDYMAAAQANGIQPLMVLTWSNPFYDYDEGDFTFPYTDSGRAGFVNYTRQVLNRWGSQINDVELWNEPGANFFQGPATSNRPDYYSQLLKEVYPAVKQLRPDLKVVAGATFPIQHGFFRELFERDALSYMDAVSIHPYGVIETLPLEVGELRDLMSQAGQVKPVWVTEYSYGPIDDSDAEQAKAATQLAQQAAMMLSIGIERMYYYLAQDDSSFPVRGLVGWQNDPRGWFRPHPSYAAYATVIRQLGGATFQGRMPTSLSVYAMRFQKGGEQVISLWSQFPATVALEGSGSVQAVNIVGSPITINPATVTIGPSPIYLSGNVTSISELVNPVLADSRSGFGKVQGTNGWSYGYAELGSADPYSPDSFQNMEWRIWRSDNYRWIAPGGEFPFGGHDGLHPSGGAWAIRRWESNTSGLVTLAGYMSRGGGGDGVGIRIFVDGNEVYSRVLQPNEDAEYSVPNVQVNVGSKIDFTVTAFGNPDNDATVHTSTVLRQNGGNPNPPRNLGIQ
jgi:Glycosyl hydrolase catalytic core